MLHTPPILASLLRRTIRGPMWHGPHLLEAIEGIDAQGAAAHPIPGAHGIWELVLHTAAWCEIAAQRLAGDPRSDVSDEENFPPVQEVSEGAWAAATQRMIAAYEALAARTRELDVARLSEKVTGHDHTIATMLHGVVEHGTYHGGQMVLLKRALHTAR
jgi:uncharacterized damage-inducible protein DinB